MHAIGYLMLFAGMALVMHGVYAERLARVERDVRVEYRFIPRTLYDEQLAQADLAGQFKNMFESDAPWRGRADVAPAAGQKR